MTKNKKKELEDKDPEQYMVYGIFDFNQKKLIYVSLDLKSVELEFELEGYDYNQYDIVEFSVILT